MMLTDTQIAKLEELGGNIHTAYHKGERMSNADGYRCKAAKSYIDVKTGEAKSTQAYLQVSLDERLAEALAC